MGLKTLDEIAIEQQSDKATVFSRTYAHPHGYTVFLEPFFEPLRQEPIKLLEIGVGGGESIRTWLEYFPNARVFGVDKQTDTNPWNTVGSGVHPRYTFIKGDQTDETLWKCFAVDYGLDWDIVIDDGSHCADGTIIAFTSLWPLLKSGGLYVIEDLATAYGGPPFTLPGWQNQMDFVKDMLDAINRAQREIRRLHYSKELAIIQKS